MAYFITINLKLRNVDILIVNTNINRYEVNIPVLKLARSSLKFHHCP